VTIPSVRIEAERELLAPPEDVWALLAEPRHLSDWWPGYTVVRPDRRGLAPNARWQVVRGGRAGLLRKPGGEGLIVLKRVERGQELAWHDVQQRFDASVEIGGVGSRTTARVAVDATWWRIRVEGLRRAPGEALSRLHALCQTAAGL
jgi:Polyketide cyclase / dehydrase and lipid transport